MCESVATKESYATHECTRDKWTHAGDSKRKEKGKRKDYACQVGLRASRKGDTDQAYLLPK
eukprot:1155183-Pelagomonas_calceolata.AAC.4